MAMMAGRVLTVLALCVFTLVNSNYIHIYEPHEEVESRQTFYSNPQAIHYEEESQHRYRRSINSDNSLKIKNGEIKNDLDSAHQPSIREVQLNDSHHQAMVDWAGKGSQVIVCLATDSFENASSTSTVYLSYDYGSTFLNKNNLFKLDNGKTAVISEFYKNEKFTDRFVFSDVINNYMFVTMDYGHTLLARKLSFTPSEVSTHPTNAFLLLSLDTKNQDSGHKLWVSTDFGETWKVLSLFVKSYYWHDRTSPPTLYVQREEPNMKSSVISFDSFTLMQDFEHKIVITDVEQFEVKEDFLFAVKQKKRLLGAKSQKDNLELWISSEGGPFIQAEFPNDLVHSHYYVADVANGQIMVCIFHEFTSNLYVSSLAKSSVESIKFGLSLERVLYFNPGSNWNNTWLSKVAHEAFADLHRVKGMRGVFIASQLAQNFTDKLAMENVTTVISFDQGGQWQPIQPPKVNVDGDKIVCEQESGCSLHISQELSSYYPASKAKMILTTKSAPGIILATGTVGKSLKGKPGLYLSTDAGLSWHHMLRGYHLYAVGDHGGLIVAVQHYRPSGETNEFVYSTDEGETWHSRQFNKEKMRVYGLMTEPGENTTTFTIFGSKPTKHEWIIVKIDMRPVFKYKCTQEDYKTWTPLDGANGRPCLLGQREIFERRVPHSNCFNGLNYDAPITVENCPCTRQDYECDFGYLKDPLTGVCLNQNNTMSANPFLKCKQGDFYNMTIGYQRIPGDTCVGGKDLLYEPRKVACAIQEEREFLLVSNRKSILRYDLMNPKGGLQTLPLIGLKSAIALEFDVKNNCLYWSNMDTKTIMRQCFDGRHQPEVVVKNDLDRVEGLALDWVSHNLYFVDGERKTIEVVHINETGKVSGWVRKTLLNSTVLEKPRAIALHPVRGFVFFTDWSDNRPAVGRMNLDGSDVKILFDKETIGWPNGISIDFETDRIYFSDGKKDFIASSDFDGHHFSVIVKNEYKSQMFAVAVYKSLLFWDDWRMFQVFQAGKEHGWGVTALSPNLTVGLTDLKVFGKWTQKGSNACGENHTCEYICTGRPDNDYTCLCPNWMKSIGEGSHKKCVCMDGSQPNSSGLCYAEGHTCAAGMFKCANEMCIPSALVCNGDNDCGDHSDEKKCSSQMCDPPSWQCKNGRCISPEWRCDHDDDCGDQSDEEGCANITCTSAQFTCKNKRCITKSYLCDLQDDCGDGSDELNCTHERTKFCKSSEFQCKATGNCLPLSWKCDEEKDCKDGSDEKDCLVHKCEDWQFMCGTKTCIFKTWVCDGEKDCPDGSDERNCTSGYVPLPMPEIPEIAPAPQNHTCTSTDFKCFNGKCIPTWWKCDGVNDCGDNSDEASCGFSTPKPTLPATDKPNRCSKDQMQCSNGQCIWQAYVCDGEKDCPSGEDEEHCPATHCSSSHFRCIHSRGCVPKEFMCNGRKDCADGSDELGCSVVTEAPHVVSGCPNGFFSCDGGSCIKTGKRCDRNHDCFDMTDELNCNQHGGKTYEVSKLEPVVERNTSVAFKWNLDTGGSTKKFEFKPSCIIQASLGNPAAWINASWITQMGYTFTDLQPDTTYLIKVYVKEVSTNMQFSPVASLSVHTEIGVPSPPRGIKVEQEADTFHIQWKSPLRHNGRIIYYTLYLTPPTPSMTFRVAEATSFSFQMENIQDVSVWLTATNQVYTSNSSEVVVFSPSKIDHLVNGLSVTSKEMSRVALSWDLIKGIDGYNIKYFYPENLYMGNRFSWNGTDNQVTLVDLAPGLKYVFEVRSFKGNFMGPPSPIEVTTLGEKLPRVEGLSVKVSQTPGTVVHFSWQPPKYSKDFTWNYRLLWGKSGSDLKQKKHLLETTNTFAVIKQLDACEEYLAVVLLAGPLGFGPADAPISFATLEDKLAPPSKVHCKVTDGFLDVMWQPPCPEKVDITLRYLVNITEMNRQKSSIFDVTSSKQLDQTHRVKMHVGGRYQVTVKTSYNESREAPPTYAFATQIPPPTDLTFTPTDGSLYWRDGNLPPNMYHQNFTYIVYLSEINEHDQESMMIPVKSPPYVTRELKEGQIYDISVALRDHQGYMSQRSSSIRVVTSPADVVTIRTGSLVIICLVVVMVLVLLVWGVVVLAKRHRRLVRSFMMFGNSHYDRHQGTTVISSDNGLDDDDDSPVIRGFSDDEPLVIA